MADTLSLRKINKSDPTPKYLQAQRILVEAIRSGHLTPGAKLPATRQIGDLVDVSLITAHKVLERMADAGWLRREVGRGTYVRDDVDPRAITQRHLAMALVLDHHVNINDYYHGAILEGLRREASTDSQRVEFFFQENLASGTRAVLEVRARTHDVGAICIHPPLENQPHVEQLAQEYPVVVLGGAFPSTDVIFVDCDNNSGAREAVRHLVNLGHRRFLLLSGPLNLSNSRDRAEGARAELSAHGIRPQPRDHLVSGDSVVVDNGTRVRVRARVTAPDRPTAIVAGGFYLALAALQIIRSAGLAVPQDISVVGFDDPASAPLLAPPLTTVRQPLDQMTAKAYQLMRRAITEGRSGLASCKLPTKLTVRGSTGPPP